MTVDEVQAAIDQFGGHVETSRRVADLRFADGGLTGNVVSCYDAEGIHICDVGWRPFAKEFAPSFIFIC